MSDLIEIYNLPRNTKIDVTHLDLKTNKDEEAIAELMFTNMDGHLARCYWGSPDKTLLLYGTTLVKVIKE